MNEPNQWEVYNLKPGWELVGTVSGDEQDAVQKAEQLVGHDHFALVPVIPEEVTS
jgi:hypothetical protein